MPSELRLVFEAEPSGDDVRVVGRGLNAFNRPFLGSDDYRPLVAFLRDVDGAIRGGLVGDTAYGWLHVDVIWMEEDIRGQGWGSRLLAGAEGEAVARGCRRAYLDTATFQAPGFYEKHGYREVGRITDFRYGHDIVYLTKKLDPTEGARGEPDAG